MSINLPEALPLLPALADRLNIKPNEGQGQVWLAMNDGRRYDLFALVNAVLDRLEQAKCWDVTPLDL